MIPLLFGPKKMCQKGLTYRETIIPFGMITFKLHHPHEEKLEAINKMEK